MKAISFLRRRPEPETDPVVTLPLSPPMLRRVPPPLPLAMVPVRREDLGPAVELLESFERILRHASRPADEALVWRLKAAIQGTRGAR